MPIFASAFGTLLLLGFCFVYEPHFVAVMLDINRQILSGIVSMETYNSGMQFANLARAMNLEPLLFFVELHIALHHILLATWYKGRK